ncbi:MAG: hypothetical protein EOP21_02345 [Hyphomicrobiales bacterium]|nr:MAG: hypothetical protein EOP21_02345 [Hyphomicrobiales bacterium]
MSRIDQVGGSDGVPAVALFPAHASTHLHDRLRQGTRVAHERVEAAFDLTAATNGRDSYVAGLIKLHRAYAGLIRALSSLPPQPTANAAALAQVSLDRLDADLAALNAGASGDDTLTISIPGADGVLGCEYVMRGSSLGGLVIFKLASNRLGVTQQHGGQFYFGDGPDTKTRWQEFQARLATEDALGSRADRVVEGALKTFAYFELALSANH